MHLHAYCVIAARSACAWPPARPPHACDSCLKVFFWVHNYHLLLVPSLLRTKLQRAKLGLFVHTPFPTSELFRILPCRDALLRGAALCACHRTTQENGTELDSLSLWLALV
jgi:hypothetical protein